MTRYFLLSIACAASITATQTRADGTLGVTLRPGETVLGTFSTGAPVIRMPQAARVPVQPNLPAATRDAPPLEIDPVTRRLRNASGWSGERRPPASVACFPSGSCRHLNNG